jgi:L-ascorbate metabolism protein UlaG (beta-lactamase superfamily)
MPIPHLTLDPTVHLPPTRGDSTAHPSELKPAVATHQHPRNPGNENASLMFVGTATTILQWEGIRLMTDPNFLHAGDHVHLGPGVTAERLKEPAVQLEELPRVDVVLLSHYHADHFDQVVEDRLRRSLPIVTTPHAKEHLSEKKGKDEAFTAVYALDTFEAMMLDIKTNPKPSETVSNSSKVPAMKVTGMPGKHVPPGIIETVNDALGAVPPVNGWMLELGYSSSPTDTEASFNSGYRIYISGDTLLIDDLKKIPELYTDAGKPIDLMLVHLGGTMIPGPNLPLLMVTMDGAMGVKLMQLVRPDITIPIHMDDYSVMKRGPDDFLKALKEAGKEWEDKVVWLERGAEYKFAVRNE